MAVEVPLLTGGLLPSGYGPALENSHCETEEMAWWLKALVAFAKDLGLVPSIHAAAQNHLTLRESMPSSDLHSHGILTDAQ